MMNNHINQINNKIK